MNTSLGALPAIPRRLHLGLHGSALWQRLDDGTERLAYGGDFGDRPSDYEFSGDGIVFADRTVSAKAQEVKAQYAGVRLEPDGRGVRVTNTNAFQGTSGTVFVARMLLDGREAWSKSYESRWRPEAPEASTSASLTCTVCPTVASCMRWCMR